MFAYATISVVVRTSGSNKEGDVARVIVLAGEGGE
jgi:hypothetical protein